LTVRGGSSSFPESSSSFTDKSYPDDDPPDHETVQERVNAWRKYQQVKSWKNTRPHRSRNCSNNTMYPIIYTLIGNIFALVARRGRIESRRSGPNQALSPRGTRISGSHFLHPHVAKCAPVRGGRSNLSWVVAINYRDSLAAIVHFQFGRCRSVPNVSVSQCQETIKGHFKLGQVCGNAHDCVQLWTAHSISEQVHSARNLHRQYVAFRLFHFAKSSLYTIDMVRDL
jgi:hypothetical protein